MPSDFPSMSPSFNPTNSPSLSSAPTQSSAPTKNLLNTGDPLLISAMELVNGEGNVDTNASSTFGSGAYVGSSLMSFLIAAWLCY